ncbi:MAG: FtsW/RodA/SpoVE family cell cycle protein [Acidimicrobiia bacterium]|nr:FtsW/RodA/SpoVE family cell cycle protein [Acidimicrobiia bacterium]
MSPSPLARARRTRELGLGLLAVLLTAGGYVLTALAEDPDMPAGIWGFLAVVVGLLLAAHLAVRRLAPRADATLLPLAALLNGLGFVAISRLDQDLAAAQATWTAVGVGAFVATLLLVRRTRVLERYRYSFALLGIVCLLAPLVPGIGREVNGSRLWVRAGPLNFQPGEAAKVLLVVFFAAYLVERRELLAAGNRRLGRLMLPDPRHLGPLALAWGVSMVVMIQEKDLGSSLLFFAVFAAMLYMATNRAAYLLGGLVLFAAGASIAYQLFDHVQVRVETWLDPWADPQGTGYQILQSLFAFGTGGFAGTGLGLGSPDKIPNAATDFVFAAVGEELGLLGTVGMVIAFLLLVGSGYRIAVQAERPFAKLFAAGLTTIVGVQTLLILGGVTRLIPLTGITLPFVSYGGSSLVANFVILALLLRISDETAADAEAEAPAARAVSAVTR